LPSSSGHKIVTNDTLFSKISLQKLSAVDYVGAIAAINDFKWS